MKSVSDVPVSVVSRRALLRAGALVSGVVLLPGPLALAQSGGAEARLAELGIALPTPPAPVANYVPWQVHGDLVWIAGQIPLRDGVMLHPGSIPGAVSIEQGAEAARQCAINILAALKAACDGNLDRVRQCLRLEGFVASDAGFNQQPAVVNGASDLMVAVFGDAGRHTRIAVGVNELPLQACVEVSAVFAIG